MIGDLKTVRTMIKNVAQKAELLEMPFRSNVT